MISIKKPNLIKRRGLGLAAIAATAALLTLFTTSPAFATLLLVQDYAVQQTSNRPCVIGDSSCKNTNNFYSYNTTGHPAGNGNTYDLFSPTYTVGATLSPQDQIPQNFSLGIDENVATGASATAETLISWDTYYCDPTKGTCGASTTGGGITPLDQSPPSGGPIPSGNWVLDSNNSYQSPNGNSGTIIDNYKNGTGFSDALLENFSLNTSYMYYFEVKWGNDTDGMEQFFIIPGAAPPPNVPEPPTLALFGLGLLGIGIMSSKRKARKS